MGIINLEQNKTNPKNRKTEWQRHTSDPITTSGSLSRTGATTRCAETMKDMEASKTSTRSKMTRETYGKESWDWAHAAWISWRSKTPTSRPSARPSAILDIQS